MCKCQIKKIIHILISPVIMKAKEMANNILKMADLGLFRDYCFIKKYC